MVDVPNRPDHGTHGDASIALAMFPTTEDPAEYSRFCGPRSLAAALDLTSGSTARLLLGVQRPRGVIEAPYTSEETMLLGLHVLSVSVETYDARTGSVREPMAKCVARARDTRPREPMGKDALQAVIALQPEASRPSLVEYVQNMFSKSLRLRDWLRFRGTWLLDVDAPEFAHWVALRDGEVLVSRDTTYWGCRIRNALRLSVT